MTEPMTHEEILATTLDTPIGPLSVLAWGDQLVGGGFTDRPDELYTRLHRSLRSRPLAGVPADDLAWLAKPLRDYFAGDLRALDGIPVHQPGTPGRRALWAALRAIPPGQTISYSELAAQAGMPARTPGGGRRVRVQPDRPRGAVPPGGAHRRQPERLLLRSGP